MGVRRSYLHFNSHAHVERDSYNALVDMAVDNISTHTLTWSVTMGMQRCSTRVKISTHTLTWSVTYEFL